MVFGQIGYPRGGVAATQAMKSAKPTGYDVVGRTMRVGIRTPRYRLDVDWVREGERLTGQELDGQLFDLVADPIERQSLFRDSRHESLIHELNVFATDWFKTLDRPVGLFGSITDPASDVPR